MTTARMEPTAAPIHSTGAFDYGRVERRFPECFQLLRHVGDPQCSTSGLAGKLVNGWELTAITNWRSGYPYSVFSNVDNSLAESGSDRADYIGGRATISNKSHGALIQQAFNVVRVCAQCNRYIRQLRQEHSARTAFL